MPKNPSPDVHELVEIVARSMSTWRSESDWEEYVPQAREALDRIAAYMTKHNIGPGLLASIANDD